MNMSVVLPPKCLHLVAVLGVLACRILCRWLFFFIILFYLYFYWGDKLKANWVFYLLLSISGSRVEPECICTLKSICSLKISCVHTVQSVTLFTLTLSSLSPDTLTPTFLVVHFPHPRLWFLTLIVSRLSTWPWVWNYDCHFPRSHQLPEVH